MSDETVMSDETTMGDSPSDSEVVARVLEGHRDEYRLLIQRYQEQFHRFAFGMVDDPDAATDLVQDSFVKAYSNLDACKNPERRMPA